MGVQLLACSGTTTTVENVQPMPIALSTRGRFGRWIIVRSALVGALGRPTLLVSTAIQTGSFSARSASRTLTQRARTCSTLRHPSSSASYTLGHWRSKKGDNDNSGNDCAWLSLEPRIPQIEQGIGSWRHTGREKLPNV